MPGHRPWTTDDDDALKAGHAAGRTLTAIAKDLDRNPGVVSVKAKALGLTWERAQTATATTAKVRDAKARRADALMAELEILEAAQAEVLAVLRGEKTYPFVMRGEYGAEHTQQIDFIPARDWRDLNGSRLQVVNVIAKLDVDQTGNDDAKSLLANLGRALGISDGG